VKAFAGRLPIRMGEPARMKAESRTETVGRHSLAGVNLDSNLVEL
jgi:hypothetical protein